MQKSSIEVITHTTCEMMWLKTLMAELDFFFLNAGPMAMHCENQAAIYIANIQCFMNELTSCGIVR